MIAARRIENDQFALPRRFVMTADDGNELRRMVRHRTSKEHAGRPERVAAVVRGLLAAVRMGAEQQSHESMGNVGVFPPLIHDLSVVQHRRTPVVVLIVRQATNAPVVVSEIEVGNLGTPSNARDADERRRRREDDAVVGKVAGVVVVYVRVVDECQRRRSSAFEVQLGNPPSTFFIGHRQQQTVGVVVQIYVTDKPFPFRLIDRFQFTVGPNG